MATYEEIKRVRDLRLDVELRFSRSDLVHGGVEYVRALGPDGLGVDDGLVGGHVAEVVLGGGVARGDIGVHRVDVDVELSDVPIGDRYIPSTTSQPFALSSKERGWLEFLVRILREYGEGEPSA